VMRMAKENRSWGYDRIGGALTNAKLMSIKKSSPEAAGRCYCCLVSVPAQYEMARGDIDHGLVRYW
jgi:hypothetical protein